MNAELAELQALQLASNTRLLVVDDEPLILASLEALLKHKHYQVDTALGGKLACQQLEQNHYDAVLLDLNMADVDGFAVMAFMADQGIDAAIVVVSGESTFDAVRKALQMGASDYVKKPYSPEELFATIDSTFHKINLCVDALSATVNGSSEGVSAREERLIKSNVLYSKAEQIGKLGHWEWDEIVGQYITYSEQYAKILDMTVAQLMAEVKNDDEDRVLVCENDRERYSQVVDSAVESKQGWDIKYSSYTKTGRRIYLHEIGKPVLDEHGVLVKTIGTIQDITEISRLEEELKQRDALFHQAEAMGNMGHFSWDLAKDKIIACSDQFARIYDMDVPEAINYFISTDAVIDLIHPDDKESFRQSAYSYNKLSKAVDIEYRVTTLLGNMRYLYVRRDISFDNDGVPFRLFGTVLNITERKQIENELEMSAERFQHYAESSSDWFWETDSDHRFIEVTGSIIFSVDWISRNIIGQKRVSAAKPKSLETDEWKQHQADLEAHKPFKNFEYLMETPDNAHWISVNGSPRFTQDGIFIGYRGTGFDITDRKTVEEKLKRMAHYDVLTNLPNRVLLADRLSQAMVQCQRRNQSLAVAYMDLDGFKAVNDTYGHDVGDKLLVALSKRMKEALREGDTLARIGGDEFIAIMVDLDDTEDKKPVLKRLLKAAVEPFIVGDAVMQVSASIGVTLYPQDGVDADQLIRHADQAMYIAKQAGKNRYHLFDVTQEL